MPLFRTTRKGSILPKVKIFLKFVLLAVLGVLFGGVNIVGVDVLLESHRRKMSLSSLHRMSMRLMGYQPCRVLEKEVITDGSELPVLGLKFEVDDEAGLRTIDPGVSGAVSLSNGVVFRKYSPTEVDGTKFKLAVKVYKGGKMSEYLQNIVKEGDEMWWTPRHVGRTHNDGGENIGMIAMGIGITAVLPVLERELTTQDDSKVTLLYANRAPADEIWMPRISSLAAAYPNRFTYTRHLTRHAPQPDDAAQCISHDRLTAEVLKNYFGEWDKDSSRFLVVGSKQQRRDIEAGLAATGAGGNRLILKSWF